MKHTRRPVVAIKSATDLQAAVFYVTQNDEEAVAFNNVGNKGTMFIETFPDTKRMVC